MGKHLFKISNKNTKPTDANETTSIDVALSSLLTLNSMNLEVFFISFRPMGKPSCFMAII